MARRLADIAKYAGVSEATVSRVLNAKPGVSDSTRHAVLTALDVLGYERPTRLRGGRPRLIGLFVPDMQNPIFPAMAEVIADALARRGLTPVLCASTVAGLSEAVYVDLLLQRHVSGFIFCGGSYAEAASEHQHYHLLRERGLPTVLINAAFDDLGFPVVSVDDAHAVRQVLRHLVALGHERLGFALGPPDHVPSMRKLAEWTASGQSPELVEHAMWSLVGGQATGERLIRRGATAIVCASDVLALGVIRAARKQGLRVPEDVSVVGFDDSALMNYTDPPLTTVRQPINRMGQAAVTLLMNQINGIGVSNDELFFEPELVVRTSTASRRGSAEARP